jgi:hypothetical protein
MAMASQVWAQQGFGLKPPIGLKLVRHQPKSEWNNSGALTPWRKDGHVHNGKHFWVLFLNHSYPECFPVHTNHQHASTYLVVTIQFTYLPTFIVTLYIPLLTFLWCLPTHTKGSLHVEWHTWHKVAKPTIEMLNMAWMKCQTNSIIP